MYADFAAEDPEHLAARLDAEELPGSIYQKLVEAAARFSDAEAWHFIDTGERRNWAQVLELVDLAAAALHGLGVREGSHVAVMATNIEPFPVIWLALARLGAVLVPVNARYTIDEVDYSLRTADAAFFLIEEALADVLDHPHGIEVAKERIVVIGDGGASGLTTWDALLRGAQGRSAPIARPDVDRVLNLQYTSGTTGFAKACLLTHRYWLICALTHRAIVATALRRIYASTSFYYMIPQRMLVQAMFDGACLVFPKTPSAARVIDDLTTYDLEFCAPFRSLMKQPERPEDRQTRIRISMSGLGDMSRGEQGEFHRRFDFPVQNIYGMTEYGVATYVPAHRIIELEDTGTIGVPAPFRQVAIFDADGKPVPAGTRGEICVRGPGMLLGYYGNETATAEAFRGDWFHTGDIGWMSEQGLFFLAGRNKDMVRRGAENISAVEVETVLRLMPEIIEAAVIPVPDAYHEEEVKAYVQLKPGETPQSASPEKIFAHCDEHLAPFKVPRYIEYRDHFDLTETFRVRKKLLKTERADLISGSFDRRSGGWVAAE